MPGKAGLFIEAQQANRFQNAQCADCIGFAGVFRRLKADGNMRLSTQIIDLIGLNFLQDAGQVGRIGQVAVMQSETGVLYVRILIDVIDPLGI